MTFNEAKHGAKTLSNKLDKADSEDMSLEGIRKCVKSAYPHIKTTEQFKLAIILRELLKEKWDI